ncbi:hypothetical protein [Streptomyces sp. NPDC059788]|uniref:hypothetical protein n=1 Tax=Streptomyces sp. NPDC059788 TaxID=3346948 RepID=UPI003665AC50
MPGTGLSPSDLEFRAEALASDEAVPAGSGAVLVPLRRHGRASSKASCPARPSGAICSSC